MRKLQGSDTPPGCACCADLGIRSGGVVGDSTGLRPAFAPPPCQIGAKPRSRRRRAARRTLGAIACCTLLLTGCSSLEGTGDKGFVSGDGTVNVVKAVDRGSPVELTGEDLAGEPLDLADLRGKPAVVVVWGSWCGPCIAEAPEVVDAAKELDGEAGFVGINLRDASTSEAQSYERTFDVPYPSFYSPDGQAMLSFPGTLGPRTIPAFVVLDEEGRIAGSIIGALPSTQTLVDLVEDASGAGSGSIDG